MSNSEFKQYRSAQYNELFQSAVVGLAAITGIGSVLSLVATVLGLSF